MIADILVDTTDFRGSFGVLAVRSRNFESWCVVGVPLKLTSCLGPAAQSSLARLAKREGSDEQLGRSIEPRSGKCSTS